MGYKVSGSGRGSERLKNGGGVVVMMIDEEFGEGRIFWLEEEGRCVCMG